MIKKEFVIGKLLSPFGLEGGIKVKSFSGLVSHFKKLSGQTVLLRRGMEEKEAAVCKTAIKGETPVLYFEGYTTPEAVKALGSFEVWTSRQNAAPLEPGEFYIADLIGCAVYFEGKEIGFVASTLQSAQLVLEIRQTTGKKSLVPYIDVFFGEADIENGKIELLDGSLL